LWKNYFTGVWLPREPLSSAREGFPSSAVGETQWRLLLGFFIGKEPNGIRTQFEVFAVLRGFDGNLQQSAR